jgi:hypothetical protein
MATIDSVIGRVLRHCIGCPAVVAKEYVLLAAIEFCQKTMLWNGKIVKSFDTDDTFPFPLVVTEPDARIDRVLSAWMVESELFLTPGAMPDAVQLKGDDWQTVTGTPEMFFSNPKGTVTIVPMPGADATEIEFSVVYVPTVSATTVPDVVFDDYTTDITSGAIAMLSILPEKPWTNLEMYGLHSGIFKSGIEAGKHAANLHLKLPVLSTSPMPI